MYMLSLRLLSALSQVRWTEREEEEKERKNENQI